ncbi:FecR domain-containing protein [Sulfurimonas sp. SAG-AH-194-I05]|nr:FecR domain-containing protein [Sulfurimonas sp. SAG-AH-194-I05]MDF1874847.1 FecR domain-containing protein [Sulfurimonas sp. SAG-AH-194-I05]
MKHFILFLVFTTSVLASIGSISSMKGSFTVSREGEVMKGTIGLKLEEKDILNTQKKSKIQIIFKDGTIVTVGKSSTFNIESYFYEENNAESAKVGFAFLRGSFKSITGKIGKIAPSKFKLRTKTATIGIRGTTVAGDQNTIAVFEGEVIVEGGDGVTQVVGAGQMTSTPPSGPTPAVTFVKGTLDSAVEEGDDSGVEPNKTQNPKSKTDDDDSSNSSGTTDSKTSNATGDTSSSSPLVTPEAEVVLVVVPDIPAVVIDPVDIETTDETVTADDTVTTDDTTTTDSTTTDATTTGDTVDTVASQTTTSTVDDVTIDTTDLTQNSSLTSDTTGIASYLDYGYWEDTQGVAITTYISGVITASETVNTLINAGGTASYTGSINAIVTNGASKVASSGASTLYMDFNANTFTGNIDVTEGTFKANIAGTISKYGFTATSVTDATNSEAAITGGNMDGNFYGNNAQAVGGTFQLKSENSGTADGVFGLLKEETTNLDSAQ